MDDKEKNELIDNILSLEEEHKWKNIASVLKNCNEMDAADLLSSLKKESIVVVFRALPKSFAADLFANLESDKQEIILTGVTDKECGLLLEELMVDDAVDAIEELPANVVSRLLSYVSPETRSTINKFLAYPENSVGSIMTSEFISLKKTMSIQSSIQHIRRLAHDNKELYSCFVTDGERHLEGTVSLRDIIIANDDTLVENIMDTDFICTSTHEDREKAAELFSKYDLITLPVVDAENRLVGMVTVDDVIDVLEEETTEDVSKMAAVIPTDKTYLSSNVFHIARNRLIWLVILLVSSIVSSIVLSINTAVFTAIPLLVVFIPILTDTGGNAGSQASVTIIRSFALHEIENKDFFKVIFKEFLVGLIAGLVLGAINLVRVMIQYNNFQLGICVSLALLFTVIVAKMLGCMLPFLANLVKVDPALMASPLITTIVDTLSLLLFMWISKVIFHL